MRLALEGPGGPPSLATAFSVLAALILATIIAAIQFTLLAGRELARSTACTTQLATIRRQALESADADLLALLAPPEQRAAAIASAHAVHDRVPEALAALGREDGLPVELRARLGTLEKTWRDRLALADASLAQDVRDDPGQLRAFERSRTLGTATLSWNDEIEALDDGIEARTHRTATVLETAALSLATVASLVLVAGTVYVQRAVLRPLRGLVSAEAEVAGGRYDVRVRPVGLSEVRDLALGFNEMVAALRAREDEVRQKQRLLTRRERSLATRNHELAAANAELDAFAYAASHDLRAPLRGIESMARFLFEDVGASLDAEARDKLDRIRRAARRLHQLIDSLLEVARAGRDLGHLEDVSLGECVREALDALAVPIRDARAEVVVRGPLPVVHGDRTRLVQVFQNLVGNAVKYSSGGGRVPHVEVGGRVEPGGDVVSAWVRDDGIGIPEDQHRRIFQLFRRLHREDEYEGAGVGLSIVQRIVQAHGGDVAVESSPGRGACFTVRLPRRPALEVKEAA